MAVNEVDFHDTSHDFCYSASFLMFGITFGGGMFEYVNSPFPSNTLPPCLLPRPRPRTATLRATSCMHRIFILF
ncbi:hypothetical protein M413DRAFT_348981 [Hebeloma cylindrosporum]|uniref:Uncharacterized protein n=1 Tax=Hebeloma cylindrosporum TaxID=76867 RepID=A0A0C3BVF7_HEBCY|nr:hypothetical protein M413DRAFT_348981 [Hebeloma cylindrosporum h7]